MHILDKIYSGEPLCSHTFIKNSSEYQKLNILLSEYINQLYSSLNVHEKQLCEAVEDTVCRLNCISEKEMFLNGFCTGVQLICETVFFRSENFE